MTQVSLTEANTSKTVEAGGVRIHYHEAGQGKPLLMLHSYIEGTTAWIDYHKNIETLSQHFRCIAMDLVNYGETGPLVFKEYQHDLHARTALLLMDSLGIQKTSILGNSIGGSSALSIAVKNPDRVERLVIGACHLPVGGSIPDPLGNTPSEGSRANREVTVNPTRENVARNLRVHIDNDELVTDELIDYYYNDITNHAERREAQRNSTVMLDVSHLFELRELNTPILITHGRYDRMVSVDAAVMMQNHLPNSHLIIFNNCGHLPQFEFPTEYNWQVMHFLDESDRSGARTNSSADFMASRWGMRT